MGKKNERESTIENRVYLFRELAAAFLAEQGAMLGSSNAGEVARARRALAEIARAACIVADTEDLSADRVAALVAEPPARQEKKQAPAKRVTSTARPKKRARGSGGGRGGG